MTVPQQDPLRRDREQWGTGLPGIPSIWDTAAPATPEPSDRAGTPATPRRGPARTSSRRWVWVGLGLAVLVVAGTADTGGEDAVGVAPPEVTVGVPVPLPAAPAPMVEPGVPPPGPFGVVPPPQATEERAARRGDGDGEPFGLAPGTTVVLSDRAAGPALDVTVLSVTRSEARLLVDLELRTPASTSGTVVPALLLRLPDGQELGHSGLADGQDVPQVLGQGLLWRGTLVFDVAPASGVLVLDDGRALAGWAVPAG